MCQSHEVLKVVKQNTTIDRTKLETHLKWQGLVLTCLGSVRAFFRYYCCWKLLTALLSAENCAIVVSQKGAGGS